METRSGEKGFALPVAILVISIVTVGLAAAFSITISERRLINNTEAAVEAYNLAQTGLELFLVKRDSFGFVTAPPAVYESTRVALDGGFADVVLERVRPGSGGDPSLYVVRSRGVQTLPTAGDTPQAERIVAQYAEYNTGELDVRSAFTALTGLHKNGSSGDIDGVDECGFEDDVAGVAVADPPGYTQSGNQNKIVPTGDPAIEDLGDYSDASDEITIDWEGIVDGSALTPDVEIPGDPWPNFPADYWPVIKVTGNFTLPSSGRGTLIVTGNLTVSGSREWRGVMLAGGHITGNGNNANHGAMISGLNIKIGGNPDSAGAAIGQNSTGNGTKRIYYNSCDISSAMARFGGLAPIQNAWMDNWPTY